MPGVGDINVFGAQYAMRIWLDPVQARELPADARRRHLGDPGAEHPGRGRRDRRPADAARADARTPRSPPSRGSRRPSSSATSSSRPSPTARRSMLARRRAGRARQRELPRSSAGSTAIPAPASRSASRRAPTRSRPPSWSSAEVERAARTDFPPGFSYAFPNDSTAFIKLSIHEVVKTLIEAIVLVVIVMFVFLQSWRADADPGDRRAGGAARHVRRARRRRLLDQHADPVRHGAVDRPAGRRRHRRRRECRARDARRTRACRRARRRSSRWARSRSR